MACHAAWQLQRLKKALHVHDGQKTLTTDKKQTPTSQTEGVAVIDSVLQAARVSSKGRLKGRLKCRMEGRLKGKCNRQNVKGTRAEPLSKKGKAYLQQRRWKWQDHPANEALVAPTCAASPTHTILLLTRAQLI